MGAAAARGADLVVLTDDNPRSEDPTAIRAAVAAGAREVLAAADFDDRVHVVAGRAQAIQAAVRLASSAQDTIVVLGKGHETGQEIAGVTHPFDDRAELRAALASMASPVGGPAGPAGPDGAAGLVAAATQERRRGQHRKGRLRKGPDPRKGPDAQGGLR